MSHGHSELRRGPEVEYSVFQPLEEDISREMRGCQVSHPHDLPRPTNANERLNGHVLPRSILVHHYQRQLNNVDSRCETLIPPPHRAAETAFQFRGELQDASQDTQAEKSIHLKKPVK